MAFPYSSGDVLTAADMNLSVFTRVFEGSMSGTTYSVSNVFSSTYDNYRITITGLGTSASTTRTLSLRFRTTSDDTGANYASSEVGHYGTTFVNSGFSGQTSMLQTSLSNQNAGQASFDVMAPNLAMWTTTQGSWVTYQSNIATGILRQSLGYCATTTQYTGISFILAGDSLQGTVRIYGYNQS